MGCETLGITNADKIRAMTVDELAAVILCPKEIGYDVEMCIGMTCIDCCKRWLQQTAEGE